MSQHPEQNDVVHSLFSKGPLGMFRAGQHPTLNRNIQKLEDFVNIHSEKPHSPTGFDCLPAEIFGIILSFAGISYISKLAVLNNLCFEKFENEDSLVYKLILQSMMNKDEKYMEDTREKFGLTYRSSLKQSIGRIKRPYSASGNELFDASYMYDLDMDERESPKAQIINMTTNISFGNFSIEMWCRFKQRVSGDLLTIYNSSKTNHIRLTLTTGSMYATINGNSYFLTNPAIDDWQHIFINVDNESSCVRIGVGNDYVHELQDNQFETKSNIESITFCEGVNMCADFTELRVWNISRTTKEIKKMADMRINPFLKRMNYENLIYYFYPNSQDGDSDQQISNKTPNMDIEQKAKLALKNIKLKKLQSRPSGWFEDLCSIQ